MTEPTKTETTAATADAVATTTTAKPGWKTTEFWFAVAAKLVGGLLVSGYWGDGSPQMRALGLAAIVLSSLGYTVSRTLVKTIGALALVVLVSSSSPACKPYLPPVTHPVVDCINADRGKVDSLIASFWPKSGGAPDWSAIEAQAIDAGLSIGGCALAEFVQKYLAPAPGNKAPADGWKAHETFERYREQRAGSATFKTAYGAL